MMAVEAGKHVLVEKPLSHSIEECLLLEEAAKKHNVLVQVGHMKRFDAGIAYAQQFITEKIGDLLALKVWYGDHTHRYTETDNLQPIPVKSQLALKPNHNEKADLKRYYMMAHGSHLLDTAQFLGGPISSLRARLIQKFDAYCWFIDVGFQNGALGHLDLTIKLRGDWHEGFQVYGEHGSVFAKTYNPWYYKSSEVECFLESEQQFYRPLGADGFSYRIQLEHFAEVILHQIPHLGTTIQQGLAITKAMIAIQQSVATQQTIYLDDLKDGAL
jgi:predicted dehydrogenase